MDFLSIKEELYQSVLNQLKEFAKSDQAREVYAIVFDLGEFDYVMRYQTISGYEKAKARYNTNENNKQYFSDESLKGFKYAVGDFEFMGEIAEEKLGTGGYLKDFFDSMAYYVCDYIDDKSKLIPRDQMPEDIYQFLIETCLYCADRLKGKLDFLNKTDDFIIFASEHDSSYERKIELISKTVNGDLFNNLTSSLV